MSNLELEAGSITGREFGNQKTTQLDFTLVSSKRENPNHLTSFMLNDLKRHRLESVKIYTKMTFAAISVLANILKQVKCLPVRDYLGKL